MIRPRLTYANVVVTAALFFSLGGTGYAVSKLPRNSVGAAQIRHGAVTSSEVRNGTLLAHDFKTGQLPQGPIGPRGPAGAAGSSPIPVLDLPNTGSGTLVDVPGVGRLEARSCADANLVLHYANTTRLPQTWVLAGSFHARVNFPADSGTVAGGASFDNGHNSAADILWLSVSGPHPTAFAVTQARGANGHCLLWGQVLRG